MKTIYKFSLQTVHGQELWIQKNAKFLSVQMQHGMINLWALIDPVEMSETRRIYIYGTGHPVPNHEDLEYLGTVQEISYVWHVFVESAPR